MSRKYSGGTNYSVKPSKLRRAFEALEALVNSWPQSDRDEMFLIGGPPVKKL